MFYQLLQVACHILLELADALRAEGVGDRLPLSGVLSAVTRVEETSLDGDEGIIVVAVKTGLCQLSFVKCPGVVVTK